MLSRAVVGSADQPDLVGCDCVGDQVGVVMAGHICWYCSEVFGGHDDKTPSCKIDGHRLDLQIYIKKGVDQSCPINAAFDK